MQDLDENGAPKANQVVGFSIKDKAKFERSIAALAKFAGQGFAALEESDSRPQDVFDQKAR